MSPKQVLSIAILAWALLPPSLSAACNSNAVTNTTGEIKVAVPFAVPVAVPVATFAPHFYSYQQFGPQLALPLAEIATTGRPPDGSAAAPAQSASLAATRCASCHGGPTPKADLSLEHPENLDPFTRLKAIRAVTTGQMPKGSRLTPAQMQEVVGELASLPTAATEPSAASQAPPIPAEP